MRLAGPVILAIDSDLGDRRGSQALPNITNQRKYRLKRDADRQLAFGTAAARPFAEVIPMTRFPVCILALVTRSLVACSGAPPQVVEEIENDTAPSTEPAGASNASKTSKTSKPATPPAPPSPPPAPTGTATGPAPTNSPPPPPPPPAKCSGRNEVEPNDVNGELLSGTVCAQISPNDVDTFTFDVQAGRGVRIIFEGDTDAQLLLQGPGIQASLLGPGVDQFTTGASGRVSIKIGGPSSAQAYTLTLVRD